MPAPDHFRTKPMLRAVILYRGPYHFLECSLQRSSKSILQKRGNPPNIVTERGTLVYAAGYAQILGHIGSKSKHDVFGEIPWPLPTIHRVLFS